MKMQMPLTIMKRLFYCKFFLINKNILINKKNPKKICVYDKKNLYLPDLLNINE